MMFSLPILNSLSKMRYDVMKHTIANGTPNFIHSKKVNVLDSLMNAAVIALGVLPVMEAIPPIEDPIPMLRINMDTNLD